MILIERLKFAVTLWWRIVKWNHTKQRTLLVYHPEIKLYLRAATRHRDGDYRYVLELASIDIPEHLHRNRRCHITLVLLYLTARARGFYGLGVEIVHNPVLRKILERRGFTADPLSGDISPSYFKHCGRNMSKARLWK